MKFIHKKIHILVCLFVLGGCAPALKTDLPQLPISGLGESPAILHIDNRVSSNFKSEYLEVEIDGFSPTRYKLIPQGMTTVHLSAGSHQLQSKKIVSGIYYFNPVENHFTVEAGKTYFIRFRPYREGVMRTGYSIQYQGWDDEDVAKWPDKNLVANPLW